MDREAAKMSVWILVAVVSAASSDAVAVERGARRKVKITISRETSYVDGPVNPDGTINYVAALNASLSKGVTRDNNAAVGLLQALGARRSKARGWIATLLEMPSPPDDRDYFVGFRLYAQDQIESTAGQSDEERVEQFVEQRDQAMKAPWSAEQYPVTAGWLRANEKALAMVVSATKLPMYYMPLISDSDPPLLIDVDFPLLGALKEPARALVARAMARVATGDVDAARADLLAVHRLARLVGQRGTVVCRLVGVAIEIIACDGDCALAASGKLSAPQLKAHLADLQSLPPSWPMWEAVDRAERFFALDAVMMCARIGVPEATRKLANFGISLGRVKFYDIPVDWDVVLRTFNSWYTRGVLAQRKPNAKERKAADRAVQRDAKELFLWHANRFSEEMKNLMADDTSQDDSRRARISQAVGKALLTGFAISLGRATELHEEGIMRGDLAELALALAAHRSERGVYPAQLADLAPVYVKAVPNDCFSDKPLRYARATDGGAGYVLYSVGTNQKDDGGKGCDVGENVDDIVVRVR